MRSEIAGEARLLGAAVQFLTRVPVPGLRYDPDWLPGAAKHFPLVGIAIGLSSAAVLLGASQWWGGAVPAILAVAASLLITGALHEDGLADSADGLGGATREARLAIMKDSRLGTYGALALIVCLGLRVAALSAMPVALAAAALVAAAAAGRFASLPLMRWMPYAGDLAAAKVAPGRPSRGGLAWAAAIGLAPFLALPPNAALPAVALGLAAGALAAWLLCRGLGGQTGDILGAVTAIVETAVLLGASHGSP